MIATIDESFESLISQNFCDLETFYYSNLQDVKGKAPVCSTGERVKDDQPISLRTVNW